MLDATKLHGSLLSVLLGLSAMFASGCAPAGSSTAEEALAEESEDEAEDERSIIGGQSASAYPESVLIDMAENGQLVSICSGAMIRPRVVLTAGHCVHGFDGFLVEAPFVGVSAQATAAAVYDWNNDGQFVDPTQHDVALLLLDRDVPLQTYPTFATQRLSWGSQVKNIGRIDDGQASWSSLFIGAAVTVNDGTAFGFPFAYVSGEKIQSGDSGGPVVQSGTHHIVAVNSGSGGGTQVLARVDLVAPWIQQQIAAWESGQAGGEDTGGGEVEPPPEPEDPCGGITYEGECSSSREVTWCEGGEVKTMRCTGQKRCKLNPAAGYYDCLR
jgi:hypothetical protein